jgi:SAM-dependent methyltransferase
MEFVYGDDDAQLRALLDESLAPRAPDYLLDLAIPLLTPTSRLLDVGCRDARHLIPLVTRSGCTGVGIDPVERNIERARAAVTAADLDQRIEVRHGVMEQTDEPDGSIDVVWCRDVLEVIPNLQAGLSEIARVLKPRGSAVIYTVFATPRLEPREAAAVNEPLGTVPQNLERAWVEEAFEHAGFRVEQLEEIGTEFREYDEERTQPVSAQPASTRAAPPTSRRGDPTIRQRQVRVVGSLASLARLPPDGEGGTGRLHPPPALASGVVPEHSRSREPISEHHLSSRRAGSDA